MDPSHLETLKRLAREAMTSRDGEWYVAPEVVLALVEQVETLTADIQRLMVDPITPPLKAHETETADGRR